MYGGIYTQFLDENAEWAGTAMCHTEYPFSHYTWPNEKDLTGIAITLD
jgi:hypothetical protein